MSGIDGTTDLSNLRFNYPIAAGERPLSSTDVTVDSLTTAPYSLTFSHGRPPKRRSRKKRPAGLTPNQWAAQLGKPFWVYLRQVHFGSPEFGFDIPGMSDMERNYARLRLAALSVFYNDFLEVNRPLFTRGSTMLAEQDHKKLNVGASITFAHFWVLGREWPSLEELAVYPVTDDQLLLFIEQFLEKYPRILKLRPIAQHASRQPMTDISTSDANTTTINEDIRNIVSSDSDRLFLDRVHDFLNACRAGVNVSDEVSKEYKLFHEQIAFHLAAKSESESESELVEWLERLIDRYCQVLKGAAVYRNNNVLETIITVNNVELPCLKSLMTVPSDHQFSKNPLYRAGMFDLWLPDEIMAFCINWIVKHELSDPTQYVISSPDIVASCFASEETPVLSTAMKQRYEAAIYQNEVDLATGSGLTSCLTPGANSFITDVHALAHTRGNHWIYVRFHVGLAEADPDQMDDSKIIGRRGTIHVYDSSFDPSWKQRLDEELIYPARIMSQDPNLQWQDVRWVERPIFEDCIQQANGSDCGPLAIDTCYRVVRGIDVAPGVLTEAESREHGERARLLILLAVAGCWEPH